MHKAIERVLRPNLTRLDYVERYGGLVQVVDFTEEVTEGVMSRKRFPVSPSVTAKQCMEVAMYKQLTPDSEYKSVSYFESRGSFRPVNVSGKGDKDVQYRGVLRFVMWLNLPSLGIEDGTGTDFMVGIMKACVGTYKITEGSYIQSGFRISPPEVVEKNPDIFGRYSYDDGMLQNMLIYPHDYFALDFQVDFYLNTNCFVEPILFAPLTCIEL